jgi:hypothetical protein
VNKFDETDGLVDHRKIVYIMPEEIMRVFGNWQHSQMSSRVVIQGCEGAKILSVFYSPERRAFGFELARKDWPTVRPGQCPEPDLDLGKIQFVIPVREAKWLLIDRQ